MSVSQHVLISVLCVCCCLLLCGGFCIFWVFLFICVCFRMPGAVFEAGTLGPLAQVAWPGGEAWGRGCTELGSSCTQQHLIIVKHLVGRKAAPEMLISTDTESAAWGPAEAEWIPTGTQLSGELAGPRPPTQHHEGPSPRLISQGGPRPRL